MSVTVATAHEWVELASRSADTDQAAAGGVAAESLNVATGADAMMKT
jgi:hypothetical protein